MMPPPWPSGWPPCYRGPQMLAAEIPDHPKTRHFHLDHLGTPRLITGNAGAEISRHIYHPFGEEDSPSVTPREKKQFTGHERDSESLDYMHARFYAPFMGRFLSVDPIIDVEAAMHNPQMWNRYSYVANNPINRIDPTGKLGCKVDGGQIDCHIVIVYDKDKSKGRIYLVGTFGKGKNKTEKILLQGKVVVGKDGKTPTGTFTASRWEKDHVSKLYGSQADTPWSKSPLGLNAFGPYQLHLKELEERGIWVHGTMGPGWIGSSEFNRALSPYSHGCVRCANPTILRLHELMPEPKGNKVTISTNPDDAPEDDD
jgi:RHS repeat-associated protein